MHERPPSADALCSVTIGEFRAAARRLEPVVPLLAPLFETALFGGAEPPRTMRFATLYAALALALSGRKYDRLTVERAARRPHAATARVDFELFGLSATLCATDVHDLLRLSVRALEGAANALERASAEAVEGRAMDPDVRAMRSVGRAILRHVVVAAQLMGAQRLVADVAALAGVAPSPFAEAPGQRIEA